MEETAYLEYALQNYIQFDVEIPVFISVKSLNEGEKVVLYRNSMNSLAFVTEKEYIDDLLHDDHDDRVSAILYETSNQDVVRGIRIAIMKKYYGEYSYEQMINAIIDSMKSEFKLTL